jgi:hypothetical protein
MERTWTKRPWPNLSCYSGIYLEELWKTNVCSILKCFIRTNSMQQSPSEVYNLSANQEIPHRVRFQVITAAITKMTVFWDVSPCSLVEVYLSLRGSNYLHHRPDDGGSKHLWNVSIGLLLPGYTAHHSKTRSSSNSPPFVEPETRWFIAVFIRSAQWILSLHLVNILTPYFFKIHCDIIFPCVPRSPK